MATLSEIKICGHCKQEKSFDNFNFDKQTKDGRSRNCKECRSSERKRLRAIDPEKYDATKKKWRENNKEFYANWAFKNRHGITKEDVLAIVEQQNGCAICGTKSPSGDGRWHVDHDHSCCDRKSCNNCRRGILCNFCNSMIGFAKENINVLENAIQYLEKYGKGN